MRNLDSYSRGKFGKKAKGECQDFGEGNPVQDNQIGSSSKITEKISIPRKNEDVCYKEGEIEKSKREMTMVRLLILMQVMMTYSALKNMMFLLKR